MNTYTLLVLIAVLVVSCGKKDAKEDAALGVYGLNPETTAFEVQCNPPPPPANPSGGSAVDPLSVPLPNPLPAREVPIDVTSCDALGGAPPHFYSRSMAGFAFVVDCNARLVRFRTHDWQLGETARIGPAGEFDANIMYIGRLVKDSAGNENCWMRWLGHVSGVVDCGAGPDAAKIAYRVDWKFDETPPEVMEAPPPGLADHRNGKHCVIRSGNCFFSNSASMGCGG